MNLKYQRPPIVRKAEQKKILPYSVEVIGGKKELDSWKAERKHFDEVTFETMRKARRDKAVHAFDSSAVINGYNRDPSSSGIQYGHYREKAAPRLSFYSRMKVWLINVLNDSFGDV